MTNLEKTFSDFKNTDLIYTNVVHDILAGIVNAGEQVFGTEFHFNANSSGFEATVKSEIGDITLVANRDLNTATAWAVAIPAGKNSEECIATAFYKCAGGSSETLNYIPDAELKSKLRTWYDNNASTMMQVIRYYNSLPDQSQSAPSQPDQNVTPGSENAEPEIPKVEAEVVSEG
jgi:hypothetical protein